MCCSLVNNYDHGIFFDLSFFCLSDMMWQECSKHMYRQHYNLLITPTIRIIIIKMRLLHLFLCICISTSVINVHAYDFIVTSEGGFYDPITDADGNQIGERFQNPAINNAGEQIGTSQGFAYNFAPNSTSDPANRNWIFFLDDGQVDVMDQAIVGATGSYEKYTGGRVSQNIASVDPDYVSEIALIEPETTSPTVDKAQHHDVHETLRITGEGGFYLPLTSQDGKEQYGEMFQNPIHVKNTTTGDWEEISMGNINQGFAFNYNTSSDPFIAAKRTLLLNRLFFLPGGVLTVLDESIVQGTGVYSKYTEGSFNESTISNDPKYIAEITLLEKEPVDSHLVNHPEVTIYLDASKQNMMEPMLTSMGTSIGVRMHVPVNNEDGIRIGTLLGYGYRFPDPAGATRNVNKHLFLKDGDLTMFNEYIVHGTGIYAGYAGGSAPMSGGKITLVPPAVVPPRSETERHSAGKRLVEKPGNMPLLLVVVLASLV